MKKIISLLMVVVMLSGCSLLFPQANASGLKQMKTNNNSLILFSKDETLMFCSKDKVDTLLDGIEINGIADEFSIDDFDKMSYENSKDKYQTIVSDNSSCQYRNFFIDFVSVENYVVLDTMNLTQDETVSIDSLIENKIFKDFVKQRPQNVNEVLLGQMLDEVGVDIFIKEDLKVNQEGEYQLVAQPIFRRYFLEDTKKIYDYEFAAIVGFNLKLVEK